MDFVISLAYTYRYIFASQDSSTLLYSLTGAASQPLHKSDLLAACVLSLRSMLHFLELLLLIMYDHDDWPKMSDGNGKQLLTLVTAPSTDFGM
jgi:hypothetical protein